MLLFSKLCIWTLLLESKGTDRAASVLSGQGARCGVWEPGSLCSAAGLGWVGSSRGSQSSVVADDRFVTAYLGLLQWQFEYWVVWALHISFRVCLAALPTCKWKEGQPWAGNVEVCPCAIPRWACARCKPSHSVPTQAYGGASGPAGEETGWKRWSRTSHVTTKMW